MRMILVSLILSGCIEVERKGYVLRSVSVDAAPKSIGLTWTFDNYNLPESGGCIELCATVNKGN